MADFGTIRPGDIDNFTFDFSPQIGSGGAKIATAPAWGISVSKDSSFIDATPSDRLLGVPSYTDTQTTHQIGLMLDGVTYTITAIATIDDGRVFSAVAELECTDGEPGTDLTKPELTVERFRADFPEFTAETFSNNQVQMWIDAIIKDNSFPVSRWGAWELLGEELYVAHQLVLSNYYGSAGGLPGAGGIPGAGGGGYLGMFSGIASSKSVNGVSISYDTRYGMDGASGMGEYAMTLYGRRLWTLMMNAGAGPIQF